MQNMELQLLITERKMMQTNKQKLTLKNQEEA